MKKLLFLLLLSSCITINIYEEPKPERVDWYDYSIDDFPDNLHLGDTLFVDTIDYYWDYNNDSIKPGRLIINDTINYNLFDTINWMP